MADPAIDPCPVCGAPPRVEFVSAGELASPHQHHGAHGWRVSCLSTKISCGIAAMGPWAGRMRREDALEDWKRRVALWKGKVDR